MPAQQDRLQETEQAAQPARSVRPPDRQDLLGNQGVQALLREHQAGAETTEDRRQADSVWAEGMKAWVGEDEPAPVAPQMSDGSWYTVQPADLDGGESQAWEKIARDHGMLPEHLVAFNQHVETVDAGLPTEHARKVTPTLSAGVELYVPSSDEILLSQCVHKAGDMQAGIALYQQVSGGANDEVLRSARERASGKLGKGYGTPGDEGVFYSQNPDLVGASRRRSEKIDGKREYRINWGADFWKCSVFLHDVVYSAGWKPDMTDNRHYRLAGQLQWSKRYHEIPVSQARPGHLWQRFGGTGPDESHNAILSSFVEISEVDDEWEDWTFSIIGAEQDRAAESERTMRVKKGTNRTDDDQVIRFFEPLERR